METVYGTKKYFQSLSGASDLYRSSGGGRVMTNDYNCQNTVGRRSTLGAYYHMNKQPSYTNDHSISSQYGYNTWGIWRDGRNIAPSTFSTKTHPHYQKTKSFSIILTTAAFIVLLAVMSIAGLAFYFSTIKASFESPILGFEGSFRIAKGDLFSTGLKYNHTTTYKQKIEFYKRFVERALTDGGLHPLRTDIWGFGEGPLIKVHFRTFLDVKKLPQNIHSVEEYIKELLFAETTALKSLYRSLRLDAESVEIKRIRHEHVKSASLFKDSQSVPTSQTHLEKRLMKKGTAPSLLSKTLATTVKPRTTTRPHSADNEPDVDVENAPVIQGSFEGSFEITKTDADIARKKVAPTKAYSSLPPKAITPYSLRVKPKKPSIEKLTTIIPQQQTKPSAAPTIATTTTTSSTTTAPTTMAASTTTSTATSESTTAATTTTTTTPKMTTTSPKTTTITPNTKPTMPSTISIRSMTKTARPTMRPVSTTSLPFTSQPAPMTTLTVPRLDSNLFTSVPILDTQPWRPIHREVPELFPGPPPALPTKMLQSPVPAPLPVNPLLALAASMFPPPDVAQHRIDEMELPFIPDSPPVPPAPPARIGPYDKYAPSPFYSKVVHKPSNSDEPENSTPDVMFYHHNFGQPSYMPGSESIERLGAGAHVQPHPLPVPLIDEVVVPLFRPLNPTLDTNDKLPFSIEAGDEKFEHLGGGVIVKKHDVSSSNVSSTPQHFELIATSPMSTITSPPTTRKTYFHADSGTTVNTKQTSAQEKDSLNANSEIADTIGEFFMDLLNLPKEDEDTATATPKQTASTEETLESRIEPEDPSESSLKEESKVEAGLEEVQEQTSRDSALELVTQASKPTFLNMRDFILKLNEAANDDEKPEAKTATTEAEATRSTATQITQTITTQTPTTVSTTTKRNRIRPASNKLPTILDDSNLFPSHSKWQFVNSSSSNNNNFGHTGNMRRVYNKTLQAWVSEDVEKSENLTLSDIKSRINNATNIQDISLIFDTLASKLGITPSVPNKLPPFSPNKLKQSHKNEAPARPTFSSTSSTSSSQTTATATTTPATSRGTSAIPPTHKLTTALPTITEAHIPSGPTRHFVELPLQSYQPLNSSNSSNPSAAVLTKDTSSEGIGAAIPVIGEAELEAIDPLKYEMLHYSQFADDATTEASHKLVTLLPVRSNSGVRTYKPLIEEAQRSSAGITGGGGAYNVGGTSIIGKSGLRTNIRRKGNLAESRRFPPPEAVVKGGIQVIVN